MNGYEYFQLCFLIHDSLILYFPVFFPEFFFTSFLPLAHNFVMRNYFSFVSDLILYSFISRESGKLLLMILTYPPKALYPFLLFSSDFCAFISLLLYILLFSSFFFTIISLCTIIYYYFSVLVFFLFL